MTRDEKLRAVIASRLHQYEQGDASKERERLVAYWRHHHPEAAAETSSYLKPLVMFRSRQPGDQPTDPDEFWTNDTYIVTLRRQPKDRVFGTRAGMIQLGIASHDGTARHDWRDFQAIKNQLAGAECEAFELYPAEARLLDPSNYYTIWCFPGVKRLQVGLADPRDVLDAEMALAPQRAFPAEQKP